MQCILVTWYIEQYSVIGTACLNRRKILIIYHGIGIFRVLLMLSHLKTRLSYTIPNKYAVIVYYNLRIY